METIGLYVHVPYCVSKCPYCDFYSLPAGEEGMDRYTQAVIRALKDNPFGPRNADTLYFGGGTPILLGARRLGAILEAASSQYGLGSGSEITLEANPYSTLQGTLRELKAAGFNRVSFGLQSAIPSQLKILGRRHTAEDARTAVEDAFRAGFQNVSLDLMLGIPQQTAEDVESSIQFCADTGVQHISAYLLKIEPGTPFAARYREEDFDPDLQADIYLRAVDRLESLGYRQYEISNFARPGFESRHNLKYWLLEPYLGVGPSAHSCLDGRRFYFPRDVESFSAAPSPFSLAVDDGPGGSLEEYLMLRLRLTQGVSLREAQIRYPQFDPAGFIRRARPLEAGGFLRATEEGFALTPQGFLASNEVIARLILSESTNCN